MNSIALMRLAGLAGLASLVTAPAFAESDPGYFYGGASIGQSRAKIDDARITAGLLSQGLVTSAMSNDERALAWKAFGGYQLNRYVGVEAGYFSLGHFGYTSTTVPAGTVDGRIRLHGINLDLVGTLPVTERLSLLARVGAQHASARDSFHGSGAAVVLTPNASKSETNVKFGAGLQYAFTPNLMLRGEAERYRINDAVGNHGDVNMYSVGLVFAFGRETAPAPRPVAAPVHEAPPPPPPPPVAVIAPPPPPPVPVPPAPPRRVSFSADTLFSFDRSELGPQGKVALDQFAHELAGMQFDAVTVEGHTDRLGSEAYNQKLSMRRAEAVKNYLVSAGGVDAGRISAVGKSESQPVTKAEDCRGTKPNPKLIACLQPDRRVDVEVTGTTAR
ncbi:MAG: outer membrane beta-barrel protein [Betaproteobacteria bacterium]